MSTDGTKSALGWLTAGESAVFDGGFAQSEGGRLLPPHLKKKLNAVAMTTAVIMVR